MRKPDRFDKMAGDMTYTRESLAFNIAKLLRRQHAAYVRMVKRNTYGRWIVAPSLLETMVRYRKGQP